MIAQIRSAARALLRMADQSRTVTTIAITVAMASQLAPATAQLNELTNWRGRVSQVTRTGLQATLDTGEAKIRLSNGGASGFATAVLVSGVDRVTVLRTDLYVRFECDFGEDGAPTGTVLKIEARDQLFATPGSVPAPAAVQAEPTAPTTGDPPASQRFVISGQLRKIDLQARTIEVRYPDDRKKGTVRHTFAIDPENTQVEFAFVDLQQAKPNDLVFVRGFMAEDDQAITAVEIRTSRVDIFPAESANGVLLDPVAAAIQDGSVAPANPAADDANATGESGENVEADAMVEANPEQVLPEGLAGQTEVEMFDFPKNDPPKTAEEKARRHYKIN